MKRQEFTQRCTLVTTENNLSVDVSGVDLADELSASATRRENVKPTGVLAPYGNDPLDAVFTCGDHGCYGRVFGAEPSPRPGVDTYA